MIKIESKINFKLDNVLFKKGICEVEDHKKFLEHWFVQSLIKDNKVTVIKNIEIVEKPSAMKNFKIAEKPVDIKNFNQKEADK